jgi:hypothetical protein
LNGLLFSYFTTNKFIHRFNKSLKIHFFQAFANKIVIAELGNLYRKFLGGNFCVFFAFSMQDKSLTKGNILKDY